ncbi:MAG: hypothetical protein JNJ61_25745 [Anaerolineae bacterium]|nr:hypothetical protein [Anaerolineae bacterium]
MTTREALTAMFQTAPAAYSVALAYDDDSTPWYHVVELGSDGLYYSFYRAASLEDAMDVLSIYIDTALV